MRTPLSRIVGTVVCTSLLFPACGEGELSKAEYIEQADEICAAALEDAQELPQPTDPPSADAYADDLEKVTEGYIAELRELEPPAEDAEELAALIETIERAGLKIVEATRANSAGGESAPLYAEALELAEDANEGAQDYGFSSCGVSEGLAPD